MAAAWSAAPALPAGRLKVKLPLSAELHQYSSVPREDCPVFLAFVLPEAEHCGFGVVFSQNSASGPVFQEELGFLSPGWPCCYRQAPKVPAKARPGAQEGSSDCDTLAVAGTLSGCTLLLSFVSFGSPP